MALFSKLQKLSKSADQATEMMGIVGVDLDAQAPMERGQLFRRIAFRCSQCEKPDACQDWMAENETADAPPSYCKNVELFARLTDELAAAKA